MPRINPVPGPHEDHGLKILGMKPGDPGMHTQLISIGWKWAGQTRDGWSRYENPNNAHNYVLVSPTGRLFPCGAVPDLPPTQSVCLTSVQRDVLVVAASRFLAMTDGEMSDIYADERTALQQVVKILSETPFRVAEVAK